MQVEEEAGSEGQAGGRGSQQASGWAPLAAAGGNRAAKKMETQSCSHSWPAHLNPKC